MTKAIYAGSFDPPTEGHTYLIKQASVLFDEVVVAVGTNTTKTPMFSVKGRLTMLRALTNKLTNVSVTEYSGLYLVDFAMKNDCTHIVRGIRSPKDLEDEVTILRVNEEIGHTLLYSQRFSPIKIVPDTVYVVSPATLAHVSSSVVKSLIGFEGWEDAISTMVDPLVLDCIKVTTNGID